MPASLACDIHAVADGMKLDMGTFAAMSGTEQPWWPMSDGHLDCQLLRRHLPPRLRQRKEGTRRSSLLSANAANELRTVTAAIASKCQSTRPLATTSDGSKRIMVWAMASPQIPEGEEIRRGVQGKRRNSRHSFPQTVHSYAIVNQQLSHIAAFASPNPPAGPMLAQVAYRFVFSNPI